jgi:hypothetical protein
LVDLKMQSRAAFPCFGADEYVLAGGVKVAVAALESLAGSDRAGSGEREDGVDGCFGGSLGVQGGQEYLATLVQGRQAQTSDSGGRLTQRPPAHRNQSRWCLR